MLVKNSTPKRLILASASPRRKELLAQIGVSCDVKPVDIVEEPSTEESATEYVVRLACDKSSAGWNRFSKNQEVYVLGADTIVVCEGQILEKPQHKEDGVAMLQALSGRTHQVMTAIALTTEQGTEHCLVVTNVTFKPLSVELCQRYWQTGEPQDKAGGYGIQGYGAIFVERIEGSYSAVVGLPLSETAELLSKHGIGYWQGKEFF